MVRARRTSLLEAVRAEFAALADPARATQQQRYMKSVLPFHGVAMGDVRAIGRKLSSRLDFDDLDHWRSTVLDIWSGAKFREERYVAVQLCGHPRAKPHQTMAALPLYERMIVEGAWWDLVDELASHRLGALLVREPAAMKRAMLAWSRSDDLWKRRSAIICQLRAKTSTDLALLYACIAPSLDSQEFFLRKAIGWALRTYADIDAAEVRRYVDRHSDRLSGLSKREALRKVGG